MKKLITIFLILVSLTGNSQVIDWDNFDSDVADSVLFVEMNNFRDSLGLTPFVYSKVLYDNISLYSTGEMVKELRLFHPDKKYLSEKYKQDIKTEVINTVGMGTYEASLALIMGPGEVCQTHFGFFGTPSKPYKTYKALVKGVISQWCRSKPHYTLITSDNKNRIWIGSGSMKLVKEKNKFSSLESSANVIYTSFQIYQLLY